jgi:CheY-like chemotaxis protein
MRSILLVDDTPANLQLLVSLLQLSGELEVRPVLTGEMALHSARLMPPDLILLDIMLPGINGYEVCRQLKADPALKHIPVVFLSALGTEAERERAFNVGGTAYITKPFQVDVVLHTIRTILGSLNI